MRLAGIAEAGRVRQNVELEREDVSPTKRELALTVAASPLLHRVQCRPRARQVMREDDDLISEYSRTAR